MVLAAYDSWVGALRERVDSATDSTNEDVMEEIATQISLAAAAVDAHRAAFNAAFCELGLKLHWDPETYRDLTRIAAERDRIRTYLRARQQPLLDAYDPEFLVDAIHTAKMRCYAAMTASRDFEPHDVVLRAAGVSGKRF